MSASTVFKALLSAPERPKARAISRFPAGSSLDAMKSRICCRVGTPLLRLCRAILPAARCRRGWCVGPERAAGHGGCNGRFRTVGRDRGDAEHPIVDADVRKNGAEGDSLLR